MSRFELSIALILTSSILLSGCRGYQSYTGIYWLEPVPPDTAAAADMAGVDSRIEEILRSVANSYGLVEEKLCQTGKLENEEFICFRNPKGNTSSLQGSDANLTIAFSRTDSGRTITVRDRTYTKETKFMRAIKRRMESDLQGIQGISVIEMKRQYDWL